MNEIILSYLNFEFIGKLFQIILSSFALVYSIVILRDVLDLQTFYESKFNIIFKIMVFSTVAGSLILLLNSFF